MGRKHVLIEGQLLTFTFSLTPVCSPEQ